MTESQAGARPVIASGVRRETIISIDAPHFCAGIVACDGKVIEAAHIIKYMKGWTGKRVADYCREKGWKWERVVTLESE